MKSPIPEYCGVDPLPVIINRFFKWNYMKKFNPLLPDPALKLPARNVKAAWW
jgi:hypothetical protein